MREFSDEELYRRGAATLVASWEQYARRARGAVVLRPSGAAIAVFPDEPERSVFNNALLQRDLAPHRRAAAVDAVEAAYRQAGISGFAAWVHEGDQAMRDDLGQRGYAIAESTRAMGMTLDEPCPHRSDIDVARADWSEHLRVGELPPELLDGDDRGAFHVLVARSGGEAMATAIAFDLDADCGIYNVGTLERARRRGLGTAITVAHLHDAHHRGCRTASLQSTPMAESVYAAVGFRDLGRILEHVPTDPAARSGERVDNIVQDIL